jgi:hypothetical protein
LQFTDVADRDPDEPPPELNEVARDAVTGNTISCLLTLAYLDTHITSSPLDISSMTAVAPVIPPASSSRSDGNSVPPDDPLSTTEWGKGLKRDVQETSKFWAGGLATDSTAYYLHVCSIVLYLDLFAAWPAGRARRNVTSS